jgi:hypothetical protein
MPKDFEVTLHFSGSHTFFISAPDDDEAVDLAHDELADLAGDLDYEVTDVESCEVDGGYDD